MNKLKLLYNKEIIITRVYIYVVLFILMLIGLSILASQKIMERQERAVKEYFEAISVQIASNIRGRIESQLYAVNLLATKYSFEYSDINEKNIEHFLENNIKNDGDLHYYRLGFGLPNGNTIIYQSNFGRVPNKSFLSQSCFQEALIGKPCYSGLIEMADSKFGYVNEYFSPVHDKTDGRIIGVISSLTDPDKFVKILGYNNFNQHAHSDIISASGEYLMKSDQCLHEGTNFFDDCNILGTTDEEIFDKLANQEAGSFFFKYGKERKIYLAAYAPIGYKNAFVLSIVPKDVIMLQLNLLLMAIIGIIVFLGIFLITLLRYANKLHKMNEETVNKAAFVDDVTGDINKNKFLLDARMILDNSSTGEHFALISMDITKFKIINELFGLEQANVILKDIYNIIKRNLPDKSIVARDFAATFIILYKFDKEEYITKYFINKILDDLKIYNSTIMQKTTEEDDYKIATKLFAIFGVYIISDKTVSLLQMSDRASIAKRSIKDSVITNIQFYDDSYRSKMLFNKALEDEMYSALEEEQFKMYLQPKFDLNTMELKGAEALVRWIHPQKGAIQPGEFIPLFEKNGFIMELDKNIWKQACEFLAKLKEEGEKLFPISVNVSRLHLNNDAFIDELVKLVRSYNIDSKYIELELTESACLGHENRFTEIMNKLKSYGFTIAMDDFGTGYSSLNMLKNLPVDVLKLDRGFITDSILSEKGKIVVQSILEMANKLQMETVAEGIETAEQALFLKKSGCQIAQGFLFGRPVDVEKFKLTFLAKEKSEYQESVENEDNEFSI